MDAFYASNATDARTKYLYAARSTLAKVVEQDNDFEKLNELSAAQDGNWLAEDTPAKSARQLDFVLSPNTTQRKQVTPRQQTNKAQTSRSPFQGKAERNGPLIGYEAEVTRLSDLRRENTGTKGSGVNIREEQGRQEKGSSRKTEQGLSKRGAGKKL
jgi:hypothetical protein